MTTPVDQPSDVEPLEYFLMGRRIRKGLTRCTRAASEKADGDVFYLWLQLDTVSDAPTLSEDEWLNVLDEAASMGVNWLVITLGRNVETRKHVLSLCRWAQTTHNMVVCLHAPHGDLSDDERSLLRELPRESTYVLADASHTSSFDELKAEGIYVEIANPALPVDCEPCDYPHKMIFVDAHGRLYTCGLVAGKHEFLLGSVFDGSLDEIIHNPELPHSVQVLGPDAHERCSGCPPLVAQHLCQK